MSHWNHFRSTPSPGQTQPDWPGGDRVAQRRGKRTWHPRDSITADARTKASNERREAPTLPLILLQVQQTRSSLQNPDGDGCSTPGSAAPSQTASPANGAPAHPSQHPVGYLRGRLVEAPGHWSCPCLHQSSARGDRVAKLHAWSDPANRPHTGTRRFLPTKRPQPLARFQDPTRFRAMCTCAAAIILPPD